MRNPALIASLLALTLAIPTFGRGAAAPTRGTRATTPNRMPQLLTTGRQVPLTDGFSVLDKYSIFDINRTSDSGPGTLPSGTTTAPFPTAPSPIFRASLRDDFGPLAVIEIPARQGSTTIYVREGQTIPDIALKVQEITSDNLRLVSVQPAGGRAWLDVVIGRNFDGQVKDPLPPTPTYLSSDASRTSGPAPASNAPPMNGRFSNQTPGSTRGFNRGNFAPGLPASGAAGLPASGATGALINPSQDPPLPPGSADDLASRMAARRLNQLSAATPPQ